MKTLRKYREWSLWALQSIGPFTLSFFEESCNSAAEDNLWDLKKLQRNLQNKDILLVNAQGQEDSEQGVHLLYMAVGKKNKGRTH